MTDPREDGSGKRTAESDEALVSVRGLKTYYDERTLLDPDPPVRAVDGVSFDIVAGETVGLVGESGCGKTTLGRTLLGLTSATAGAVTVNGREVTDLGGRDRRRWQRDTGMVYQDPEESLNERMTVGEIVSEPLEAHGWPALTVAFAGDPDVRLTGDGVPFDAGTGDEADATAGPGLIGGRPALRVHLSTEAPDSTTDGPEPRVEVRDRLPFEPRHVRVERDGDRVAVDLQVPRQRLREARVRELLDRVGLREEHFYRYPHQFSGGQRQRVGIARALALEPEFLVLDEPVSALDVSVQARIINLLDDLQEELGLTYLFIAHDLAVVRHIADRVAVMYLGNIVEMGPTETIFERPAHPYTVSLLSAIPGSGSPWDGERVTIRGAPPSPRDPPEGCPFATRCPAKIRPAEPELPEATWRDLDALRALLRARARVETTVGDRLRRLLGIPVGSGALSEARDGLLDDHDLPTEVRETVEAALDRAANGDDRAAAARLREAFGSRCDAEHPAPRGGDHVNRCLRREDEFDDGAATVERRRADTDAYR